MNIRKQYLKVLIAFCSLLILIFFNTCKKIELIREILVQTDTYLMETGTVQLNGTIIDAGEGINDYGFYISESYNPQSGGKKRSMGSSLTTGSFSYDETELQGGKTYYYQAYAEDANEVKYGDVKNISTADLSLSTQAPTILSKTSATLNGNINNLGFEAITEYGFYWSLTENPQGVNKELVGSDGSTGAFSKTISGLTIYTNYYYVAYAINNTGTKYGSVTRFKIENVWTLIGNFEGSGRCNARAFSLRDFGYIAGGQDAGSINDFYRFSPDPENWTLLSSGNSPVYGTAFTIGNKAYVIDINGSNLTEFNPDKGMWVAKATYPGLGQWNLFAFGVANRGYVGSGNYWDGEQYVYSNDFWEFDPTDDITNGTDINGDPMGSWTQKADFQGTGRQFGEGFSIATYGYVCSGYDDGDLNDFWQYDPYSTDNGTDANDNPMGVWSQKTDYPGPPGTGMVSFIIDNKAYIFNYGLWQYDPVIENWKQMADFPGQQRWAPVGFAINNKGYVGTGTYNDGGGDIYLNDFWEYLPHQ